MSYVFLFIAGVLGGRFACVVAGWTLGDATAEAGLPLGLVSCRHCQQRLGWFRQMGGWLQAGCRCAHCGQKGPLWPFLVSVAFGGFLVVFAWLLLEQGCQRVPEVQPAHSMAVDRLPYQAIFLFLMLVVTITDVLDYAIPDLIIWAGVLIAVIGATVSGDLQMIHIWVDWDYELAELYGPYLPEWMKRHPHIHGLAWSVAGMLSGAGLMWLIRILATAVLGVTAVGFGDVLLMLMIGAFLGWQPTLCALAIAPVGGLCLGLASRVFQGRTFVAFGPYLTFSAVVVLCSWRFLWEQMNLRIIFSHWPTVAGLVAGTLVMLTASLALVRLVRAVPVATLKR